MRLISAAFSAAAATLALCAASAQQADPAAAAAGRTVYIDYGCAQCHGTAAQGSISTPSLAQSKPYGLILAKLRSKSGAMPRYTAQILPDADVAKIAAFLGSLPPPPKAASIPELSD
jgi:mono/diheme cytochrome c family protein